MPIIPPPEIAVVDKGFRHETIIVATRLRTTLISATTKILGTAQKVREVSEKLGLDIPLCWQLCKVIAVNQPLDVCVHVPAPAQMRRLMTALRKRGTTKEELATLDTAYQEFENHVNRYARSRDLFHAMIAHIGGEQAKEQMELTSRRAAFEAQRSIWGVETRICVHVRILHPSLIAAGQFDLAVMHLRHNMTRFNPQTRMLVERNKIYAEPQIGFNIPLDPEAAQRYGCCLIPKFCSHTDLPLQTKDEGDGFCSTYIVGETVGYPNTIDLASGKIHRNWRLSSMDNQLEYLWMNQFATPIVSSIHTLLVHRSMTGNIRLQDARWGHVGHMPQPITHDTDKPEFPQMSCVPQYAFVGSGAAAVQLSEVPQSAPCIEYACESQGWKIEEMDVYQVRWEYPLMDTMVSTLLGFDKPPGTAPLSE